MAGLALAGLLAACGTVAERQATYGVHRAPPPQESATPDSPTMSAAEIARAQVLLTDLGYRPGPANGRVEPETEEAIRAFQEAEGLSVDGRMSAALLAQLEVADRSLSVRRAQVRLLALGYHPGPIDGTVGPRTRAAISVYEQDRGLPVRGEVTEALLQALRDEQPTPLPRARLTAEETTPETERGGGEQPATGEGPTDAGSLAAVATAAGAAAPDDTLGDDTLGDDSPAGEGAGVRGNEAGTAPSPVDLESAAPSDTWGALGSDDRTAPVPILPSEGDASGPAQSPPAPAVNLAALPDDGGRTGRPLAAGDRIRLAVGDDGADIVEREIGADGQLALPGGLTVTAAGLTLAELKRAITVKLVESYLQSLSVEVSRSGAAGQQAPQ